MKGNKTDRAVSRKGYEPVKVEVVNVMPHGILCQSGGGVVANNVEAISSISFDTAHLSAF